MASSRRKTHRLLRFDTEKAS
jgi:hypothetical protein